MLTTLDKRFIQVQLTKLSDAEIADMLGKPESEIHAAIDEMTGGGVVKKSFKQKQDDRLEKLIKQREEKKQKTALKPKKVVAKKPRAPKANNQEKEKRRIEIINKKREDAARKLARQQAIYRPVKKVEKVYESRSSSTDGKIAVRINHKTIVFVKPGTDIEKIKKMYK